MKKDKTGYFDSTEAETTLDINKREPAVVLVTTNRSAGKTTKFLIRAVERFKETGAQLVLLYRTKDECSSAGSIFTDVLSLYPQLGIQVVTKPVAHGIFYEMRLDDYSIGYAISLSMADKIKKYSALFARIEWLVMDEFQLENGRYLPNEVKLVNSILFTVARGGGKQSRDNVKLFLLGNNVSLMNPYFIFWKIYNRIQHDTHIIRGDGWIAIFEVNLSAQHAIQENAISRAFKNSEYVKYSTENTYLINTEAFIERPKGKSYYVCTIKYRGQYFGLRDFQSQEIIYCSHQVEKGRLIFSFLATDHDNETQMLNRHSEMGKFLKTAYQAGQIRFENIECKEMLFDFIAINLYQ